jgi:PAS domain S-box-containing protein
MTDESGQKAPLCVRIKALLDRDPAAEPVIPTVEAQELVRQLKRQLLDLDARDAAERHLLTDRVRRLGQLYATLSKVNQAIIHLRDRQQLFEEICRIAVVDGSFSLAWIGWVDERTGAVLPLASAGDSTDYVGRAAATIRDEPRGRGPVGTSLREDRPVVINCVHDDPTMAPWREPALACGYESVAALPLHLGDRPVAAMTFYSSEPGFFDPERIRLLEEVGPSLSFALEKMQADAERHQSEQRYRDLFESMTEGCVLHEIICDEQGEPCDYRYLDMNQAFERMTGLKRDALIGHTRSELNPGEDPKWLRLYGEVALTGRPGHFAQHALLSHKDIEGVIYSPGPGLFAGLVTDVTDRKRAEAEVESLSQQRRLALDAANLGWVHYDPITQLTSWDDRCQEIFGATEDQRRLGQFVAFLHPDDVPHALADFEAAVDPNHPRPYQAEYRLTRPDGSVRWIAVHGLATFEGEGPARRATSFVSAVADITERRQADQALRDSEGKYRQLFATENDALVLFDAQTYEMLDVNKSAERLYGYTRAEFLTKTCWDMTVEPEETGKSNDRLLAHGFDRVPLRYHRKKDGTVFPMEFSASCFKLGDRTVFSVAVRDITEHRRADQALRESEEKYRQLFATENDAIVLFDVQTGTILDANESALRLYGYTRDEFMVLTNWDLSANHEITRQAFNLLHKQGLGRIRLNYHRKKDGTIFPVEISASAFMLGERQVICAAVHDITARLRAEQEADDYRKRLQALTMELSLAEERERKDLATTLHDDLIQMLALIRIRLALAEQTDQEAQRREGLAEVRRLVDLANASARSIMLHLSHPILYERGLVPAVEWLAADMLQLHHLAVTIQTSPAIDPLDLKTRVVLFRCLRELLVNVAKHAGADRASVELVRTDDTVMATVADLGSGFDPQAVHVRSDGGFGLFTIKERLALLGGQMTIRSAPGQGTTVTLEVPAAGPASETPSAVIRQTG